MCLDANFNIYNSINTLAYTLDACIRLNLLHISVYIYTYMKWNEIFPDGLKYHWVFENLISGDFYQGNDIFTECLKYECGFESYFTWRKKYIFFNLFFENHSGNLSRANYLFLGNLKD